MYSFIFYVMYNYQMGKGSGKGFSRYNASLILTVALILHIFLILTLVRKFFKWDDNAKIGGNKLIILFCAIATCLTSILYFNSMRIDKFHLNSKFNPSI